MAELYPEIDPHSHGWLDVDHGHRIYWEACGNPQGKPVLVVHGGPGSGCSPRSRRYFDPTVYRIILFDQRNCGRSTPHASQPDIDLTYNTTHHLIQDMDALRQHLHIERWLVCGGSWGSTLSLAYAEQFPYHVSEMILFGVTTGRHSEMDWLFRGGVAVLFPQEWDRLVEFLPASEREGDIVAAYYRWLMDSDPQVFQPAAASWCHLWLRAEPVTCYGTTSRRGEPGTDAFALDRRGMWGGEFSATAPVASIPFAGASDASGCVSPLSLADGAVAGDSRLRQSALCGSRTGAWEAEAAYHPDQVGTGRCRNSPYDPDRHAALAQRLATELVWGPGTADPTGGTPDNDGWNLFSCPLNGAFSRSGLPLAPSRLARFSVAKSGPVCPTGSLAPVCEKYATGETETSAHQQPPTGCDASESISPRNRERVRNSAGLLKSMLLPQYSFQESANVIGLEHLARDRRYI